MHPLLIELIKPAVLISITATPSIAKIGDATKN
jgi:hypothetical protein